MNQNQNDFGIELDIPTDSEMARNRAGEALNAARYTVKSAIKDIEQAGFSTVALKVLEALSALDKAAAEWAGLKSGGPR